MNRFLKDSKYSPFVREKDDYKHHSTVKDIYGNLIHIYGRDDNETLLFLKGIHLENSYDKDRFMDEVKTLVCMRLKGFPFIKIDGFGCQNNDAFIAVEYLEGGSLQAFLDKQLYDDEVDPLDDTQKMIILYGTAFGLCYLHSKGYVHRDIKPDNIFLNDNREPFIGDYGFSKKITNTSRMTSLIGTVPYMAPELLNEKISTPDNSIDVYSFAITSLQIITNDLKFDNKSIFELDQSKCDTDRESYVKNKILSGKRYDIPQSIPDGFKEFIQCCWSDNPSERWKMSKICQLLKHDLILPDCDIKKFNEYVQQLDNAFKAL